MISRESLLICFFVLQVMFFVQALLLISWWYLVHRPARRYRRRRPGGRYPMTGFKRPVKVQGVFRREGDIRAALSAELEQR